VLGERQQKKNLMTAGFELVTSGAKCQQANHWSEKTATGVEIEVRGNALRELKRQSFGSHPLPNVGSAGY